METAGHLRTKEAIPTLREVLGEREAEQGEARGADLAWQCCRTKNRPMYAQYLNDRDDGLRAAAAEGFARLKNPADLPMIEQKFNSETKMNPRLSLAFASVSLGQNGLVRVQPAPVSGEHVELVMLIAASPNRS